MKKMIIYLILALSIILGACGNGENNIVEPEIGLTEEDLAISVQAQDVDIIERSETISDVIVELYGIDDATTIVIGDEALVGIRIAYDEKLNVETKELIESTVKAVDEEITNIYLTDKANIFSDINKVVTEILQGDSYDNYLSKINSIKSRIR